MIQGQIALKKESDGNDNKLIGISNKCNTQTAYICRKIIQKNPGIVFV